MSLSRGYGLALILGTLITIFAGLMVGNLLGESAVRYSLAAEKNPGGSSFLEPDPAAVDVGVQLLTLDTDGQFATILYTIQPNEEYGSTDWYENRIVLNRPIRLTVGSLGIQSGSTPVTEFTPGPITGVVESLNAYDASVPEDDYLRDYDGVQNETGDTESILGIAATSYPFDSYIIDVGTKVESSSSGGDWQPVRSSAYFVGAGLPGMVIDIDRVPFNSDSEGSCVDVAEPCSYESDWASGASRIQLHGSRSSLTIAIGLFGFLLTSLCAINSFALTVMVARRRRPASLNVIALHAAVLFSLPAIRASIPGAPKLGITLDAIAFFPAIVIVVFSLLVSSLYWATISESVTQ
jgi:hypothetical protein